MEQSHSLIFYQLFKKIVTFYGIQIFFVTNFYKIPALGTILSRMNALQALPSCLFTNHLMLFFHVSLCYPDGLFL